MLADIIERGMRPESGQQDPPRSVTRFVVRLAAT
jgi:hypothetical protein